MRERHLDDSAAQELARNLTHYVALVQHGASKGTERRVIQREEESRPQRS